MIEDHIERGFRRQQPSKLGISCHPYRAAGRKCCQSWTRDEENVAYSRPPKTKQSKRSVALTAASGTSVRPLVSAAAKTGGFVFLNTAGTHIDHRRAWGVWDLAAMKAQAKGLAKRPRIADLRHANASWLLHAGLDIYLLQKHLGHPSITIALDRYSHLLPRGLRDTAAAVERALALVKDPLPSLRNTHRPNSNTHCNRFPCLSQFHRLGLDLVGVARNRAASVAYLVSEDDDLGEVVEGAQDLGRKVVLVGVDSPDHRLGVVSVAEHLALRVDSIIALPTSLIDECFTRSDAPVPRAAAAPLRGPSRVQLGRAGGSNDDAGREPAG